MKTILVWLRNDLRIHDHPALATAIQEADVVVPVFIFDTKLLHGERSGSNRNRFLLESLQDLKNSVQKIDGDLFVRTGEPVTVLRDLAKQTGAQTVYYTADVTPYAIKRDKAAKESLEKASVSFRGFPGRLIVGRTDDIRAGNGNVYKVFTPFYKNWLQAKRREMAKTPARITVPSSLEAGDLPDITDLTKQTDLSPDVVQGGETAGRKRLQDFLNHNIENYKELHNDMAGDGTSRISAYLHFGCLSPLEIETMLGKDRRVGPQAWHRQLAWREFYHYVLYHYPTNRTLEFQEKYRGLEWNYDEEAFAAWQQGQTGYPIVDAGMRQLLEQGWMHNRARLIVGSFLTKDLGIDWRLGEKYFMQKLVDGDEANNNGNWQWITSVGVDPAPVFRRIYNPASQQASHDPSGSYVRRHVPELKHVPDKYLAEPWKMPEAVQQESGCIIGKDYPQPIIDHKEARHAALEQFRSAAAAYTASN